jgi:LEA14-like dessication related protein
MKGSLSVLLIFTFFFYSCGKPQAFDYRDLKNLRLANLGTDKAKVSMDLVYFNPNNYGVNLKNVDCEIFLDSSLIGKFVLDTMMRIPKKSEFTLPATMEVDIKNIYKNSVSFFLGKDVQIGAKGTTKVGKGGLYVTIPFTYQGRHKLNLF